MEKTLVWNKRPALFLQKELIRISEFSPPFAERLESTLLSEIAVLIRFSEKYPLDRFKKTNSGQFRAFEVMDYRISYKVTDHEVRILRIRHVKKNPKPY